jgi:hypothetical protein
MRKIKNPYSLTKKVLVAFTAIRSRVRILTTYNVKNTKTVISRFVGILSMG